MVPTLTNFLLFNKKKLVFEVFMLRALKPFEFMILRRMCKELLDAHSNLLYVQLCTQIGRRCSIVLHHSLY
jgi:hypothetical protein